MLRKIHNNFLHWIFSSSISFNSSMLMDAPFSIVVSIFLFLPDRSTFDIPWHDLYQIALNLIRRRIGIVNTLWLLAVHLDDDSTLLVAVGITHQESCLPDNRLHICP